MAGTKIIDVSHWQGKIGWDKAATEVGLAILRASCGMAKDERIDENAQGCRDWGIPFGVYHFIMATTVSRARQEAEVFYKAAAAHSPAFWVLDVEHPPLLFVNGTGGAINPGMPAIVAAFRDRLVELGAERLVMYTYESVYPRVASELYAFRWFAAYGRNDGTVSKTPTKGSCELHQYTSRGKVSGITTNVDLSQVFCDKPLSWFTGDPYVADVQPVEVVPDEPATDADEAAAEADVNADGLIVRVNQQKTWNVRAGNGTNYESLGFALYGANYDYIGMAVNGWVAVPYKGGVGWLSPKCCEVFDRNRAKEDAAR